MADGRPFAFAGLWDVWRSPDGEELEGVALPPPGSPRSCARRPRTMQAWPVSRLVNAPRNDAPELIAPAVAEAG